VSATAPISSDVIIVGAGLAGTATAILLSRQGIRVTLIDRWATYPACFKAEKLEPDQIELLRKFDLLSALTPGAGHIRVILIAEGGRILHAQRREQFGILYQDMVNPLRARLGRDVNFKIGRVQDIVTSADVQRVTLVGGDECTARLVVLACGVSTLQARLGLAKHVIQKDQSLAFGFTIARTDGQPFPFDALTYYPTGCAERVAFLTLFLVGTTMRANLFVYWAPGETHATNFAREPRRELSRILPKLTRAIGDFDVVTNVESSRIDLYQMDGYRQPGLVLMADAFQGVCPTTGTGISRVLTDVDVLCHECVPHWLSTPGMSAEKIGSFYDNVRKRETDEHSLVGAWGNRQMAVNGGLPWMARRLQRRWRKRFAG
jgi:2-polyprenyl-6-methoxyphenol hydroxylase-like FAD-dependent oxidoreductase